MLALVVLTGCNSLLVNGDVTRAQSPDGAPPPSPASTGTACGDVAGLGRGCFDAGLERLDAASPATAAAPVSAWDAGPSEKLPPTGADAGWRVQLTRPGCLPTPLAPQPAERAEGHVANIVRADLDHDGDDELGFHLNVEGGPLRWYELTADGQLGALLDVAPVGQAWNELFAADFDGDGVGELGLWRSDLRHLDVHALTPRGSAGSVLLACDQELAWSEVFAADLDDDRDDELVMFRAATNTFVVYEGDLNAQLGRLGGERPQDKDWTAMASGNIDGAADEIVMYNRELGYLRYFHGGIDARVGMPLPLNRLESGASEIVCVDLDNDGRDELGLYWPQHSKFVLYRVSDQGVVQLDEAISTLDLSML